MFASALAKLKAVATPAATPAAVAVPAVIPDAAPVNLSELLRHLAQQEPENEDERQEQEYERHANGVPSAKRAADKPAADKRASDKPARERREPTPEEIQQAQDNYNRVFAMQFAGTRLELVGTWLWISGDTKPHKEALKELGFKFSAKNEQWYLPPTPLQFRRRGKMTDAERKQKYGCKVISGDDE